MESTESETEGSEYPPMRVLVQTLTHPVPGTDNMDKCDFIFQRICKHQWNCDFEPGKVHRWATYNDAFAIANRRCFFLIDVGKSDNDDDVPVICYEWTGESLVLMPQLLQDPKIQTELKEDLPFTWRPRKYKRPQRRRIIESNSEDTLSNEDLEHMRGHPEDLRWLKTHVRPRFWPRFWPRFASVANPRQPRGAPDIEELISTPTTPETALSILCAGAWDLDSDKDMQMIFYRNAVGEMFLRRILDARTKITAVTQWKSLNFEQLDQICIENHNVGTTQDQQKTQIIAQFDLEITLTTHDAVTYTPIKKTPSSAGPAQRA